MRKAKATTNVEIFRCGECLHYNKHPLPSKKVVCSQLGARAFTVAPICYSPDYTKVLHNIDEFALMVTLFNNKTPQQRKIMLGILRQQPVEGVNRYALGTQLFLQVSARDYISNYLHGYVAGYTNSGQLILIGSPSHNTRGKLFYAYLRKDAELLTASQWAVHYRSLLAQGRIQDPASKALRNITDEVKADTYEVPTIDSAPKDRSPLKIINKRTSPVTMSFEF